ncbi:hypothetical protein HY497_00800 [Candidatus Woesearchaeota archaeon]|nr:hypothetical protein [Candidatus Woesearchaeota archaeon]
MFINEPWSVIQPTMIQLHEPILINGIGTVGSRIARLLLSMGVPVHGAKYSASPDDKKTEELLQLYTDFGRFPIVVALGEDYDERAKKCRMMGLEVLEQHELSHYKTIIDATEGDTTVRHMHHYKKNHTPFLVQGGTESETVPDFVSAPRTVCERYTAYEKGARQVSCNSTFCSTALGLVLKHVTAENIVRINLKLQRRCRDPGEKKELKANLDMKDSHHAESVAGVLPQLQGKIFSQANTNAWEHFHHTTMLIDFARPVAVEEIKQSFRDYERCIFLEHDFSSSVLGGIELLRTVSQRLHVPDADTLLPIYNLRLISPKQIEIAGYIPQRSIVALSCVDWLWGALGVKKRWEEAFRLTNENARWHGYSVRELKDAYENALEAWRMKETAE